MKTTLFMFLSVLLPMITFAQIVDMEKSLIRHTVIDGQGIDVPSTDACCTSEVQLLVRDGIEKEIPTTEWYVFRYDNKEVLAYIVHIDVSSSDNPYLSWGVLSGRARLSCDDMIAVGGWTGGSSVFRSTIFLDFSNKKNFALQAVLNEHEWTFFAGHITDNVDKVAIFKNARKTIEYLMDNGYNYGECSL